MPNYDHKCTECGHKDDAYYAVTKLEENSVLECPSCLSKSFERVMSAPAFDCVGAGFYINDSGKKAWKKNMNTTQQASVLAGESSPY